MKKPSLLAALILSYLLASAQPCQLKASSYDNISIEFSIPEPTIQDAVLLKQTFSRISLPDFTWQNHPGQPALPSLVKLIEVPLGNGLTYTIESMICDTLDGAILGLDNAIIPAQPSRSKSDTSIPTLVKDLTTYTTNAFCGAPAIELEEIGIARDRNLASVTFNPIRWNPITNQLIIIKHLTLSVQQSNIDIVATKRLQRHRNAAYGTGIPTLNSFDTKDNIAQAPLRYTIIAHSMFRGALDEFAAWKRRKGFLVDLVYTDESNVGSTFTSIKNYLQGLYDNATPDAPAPTFVLFVGDVAQIPAEHLYAAGSNHYSDLNYCCWTGNDYIPDCYYGRFSAQNLSQLEPQINKTLMYEQYTFPDDSYLNTAVLIAGVDGGYAADNAYRYADPSMDYIAKTYITTDNGFSNIYYYKNNTAYAPTGVTVTGSSNDNSAATALISLYNSGCGWVNYSAHGATTYWHKPNFTISNVAQMTNNNKPQIMIGNCCLTNSFQVDACLGEALLRKGDNAGAVVYIGGSNNTYWAEDFYWSVGIRDNISNTCNPSYDASNLGMYDKLFHQHGEAHSKWFTYMGATVYAGNMSVQSSTSNLKQYYWQIYHLMGDPSLMPYNKGQAQTLTPTLPSSISVGVSQLVVNTEPYAYVALKDPDSVLVAACFANSVGTATLSFPTLTQPGTYEVAISAQYFKPFFQPLTVNANGPFVSVTDITPTAELRADADISFDLTLTNLGIADADSLFIIFQSPTGHLLFDSIGWIQLPSGLQTGETLTLLTSGSGHIWGGTPDQYQLPVNVTVRWGNTDKTMCTCVTYFTVAAPKLHYSSHTLINNFEADSTAILTITNLNSGHKALSEATVTLLCLDPLISLSETTSTITSLDINQASVHEYTLTLNGPLPNDRAIPFLQSLNDGFRTVTNTLMLYFGSQSEIIDFEDDSWNDIDWISSEYPWEITDYQPHSGTYCLRSHTWSPGYGTNSGSMCNSGLSLIWTSSIDDTLSFYKKVSSEDSYDFYRFYIDDELKEELSGPNVSWSRSAFFIPAGTHTFKWSYEKDYSVYEGSDCAWIDDISLPLGGSKYIYLLDTICMGGTYPFGGDTILTNGLVAGYNFFADTSDLYISYLTLYLTEQPTITIEGGDVTIRKGETVRLSASGAENYLWNNGFTMPIIDAYPTETATYTVTGFNGGCSASASTTITVDGYIINITPTENNAQIRLYPNPAHHTLIVEGDGIANILVLNTLGQILLTMPANTERTEVDLSALPSGIYLLQTRTADGHPLHLSKFLKK